MSAHGLFYKKLRSKSTRYYLGTFLLVCFASVNVLYSQVFPSQMWDVMEGKVDALVAYLRLIQNTPQHAHEMRILRENNNTKALLTLEGAYRAKDLQVSRLKKAAIVYPYNPLIYYNLSILLQEKGFISESAVFFQKAKDIDIGLE